MTLSGALKGDTSLVSQLVKNTSANAEDPGDTELIPVSGRSPGERKGNPLQYFFFFFASIFLLEKFHGQRSLVGYSPWDHKESDMIEDACMSPKRKQTMIPNR